MIVEKSVSFNEPVQKVWDKITDMEGTINCMPGVKSIEVLGENRFRIEMEQKVGFITVKFKVELRVTDLKPPTHLETAVDGTAHGGLGKAFQKQSLDLIAVSEDETKLVYKGDLTLSGRIGTFGNRVLGGKINSVADEFLKIFADRAGLIIKTP